MAACTRTGAEHDLSLTQLRVIAILQGPARQDERTGRVPGIGEETISGLVHPGQKRGLFRREANPTDGRGVDVVLCRGGMELAERGAAQIAQSRRP